MERLFGQVNVPIEFSLQAARPHRNIFQEVDVDVVVSGPRGEYGRIPAYWAGDNVFRIRFSAPDIGEYSWVSECSDSSDKGLHKVNGSFQLDGYAGTNPLFQHGRSDMLRSR